MSRKFLSLGMAVIATVALAVGTAAAAPQAKATSAKTAKASTGSHSLSGTLEKVNGNTLTLKTSSGTETVTVGSDAKISQGSKSLSAADLSMQTGSKLRVNYDEMNGQKTAHVIHVSGGMKSAKKTK
jgi:hypothetical protein